MAQQFLTFPTELEINLLRYVKVTYLPKRFLNPKNKDRFTDRDLHFFAEGISDLSNSFTVDRNELPKNYFNRKEYRAGYLIYFLIPNFLKFYHCFELMDLRSLVTGKDDFKVLDIGSGPGTALLALLWYWKQHKIKNKVQAVALDQNAHILKDARALMHSIKDVSVDVKTIAAPVHAHNVSRTFAGQRFDMIVLGNTLNEFGGMEEQEKFLLTLFADHLTPKGHVVIVEPALQRTTRHLMELRDQILTHEEVSKEFVIKAPCLHNEPCPMIPHNERDWCHQYLDWHRPEIINKTDRLIGNRKDFLKMAYLLMSRGKPAKPREDLWRAVSSPLKSNGKVEFLLCNAAGMLRITRLDKHTSEKNKPLDYLKRGDLVTIKWAGPAPADKTRRSITQDDVVKLV